MTTEFKFGTWYPIETCPRDGTSFLALECLDYGYDEQNPGHHNYTAVYWNGYEFECDQCGQVCSGPPTHWMPLPPPPHQGIAADDARATSPSGDLTS